MLHMHCKAVRQHSIDWPAPDHAQALPAAPQLIGLSKLRAQERGAASAQQRREQWDTIEAAAAKQRQQQRLTSMYRL